MTNKDSEYLNPIHGKRIIIPMDSDKYRQFVDDNEFAKSRIKELLDVYPELLPKDMTPTNFVLNGNTRVSKKMGISLRRLRVNNQVYQIHPSYMFPYMKAETEYMDKGLILTKYQVPFHVIAYVMGKDENFWYRSYIQMGKNNIVGTTIKAEKDLPEHLLSDEEHVNVRGKKSYVATTAAKGCILGVQACTAASGDELTKAYGVYKEESQVVSPTYEPSTVNTDGWAATQSAWKNLFPKIVIIQCFLHAFIKVRDRALKSFSEIFTTISEKVWDCYKTPHKLQQFRK